MPKIVVVVTGAAAYFGGLSLNQRNNRMIRYPAAFYAVIVNDIT